MTKVAVRRLELQADPVETMEDEPRRGLGRLEVAMPTEKRKYPGVHFALEFQMKQSALEDRLGRRSMPGYCVAEKGRCRQALGEKLG